MKDKKYLHHRFLIFPENLFLIHSKEYCEYKDECSAHPTFCLTCHQHRDAFELEDDFFVCTKDPRAQEKRDQLKLKQLILLKKRTQIENKIFL